MSGVGEGEGVSMSEWVHGGRNEEDRKEDREMRK